MIILLFVIGKDVINITILTFMFSTVRKLKKKKKKKTVRKLLANPSRRGDMVCEHGKFPS